MEFGFPNVVFVVGSALWLVGACLKGLGWTVAGCPKEEPGGGADVDVGCPQQLGAAGACAKGFGAAGKDG